MTFRELEIAEPILKAICEKGYEKPTPIQEKGIPVALGGGDMLGIAQTGTGKTATSLYRSCNIYWLIVRRKKVRKHEAIKDVS